MSESKTEESSPVHSIHPEPKAHISNLIATVSDGLQSRDTVALLFIGSGQILRKHFTPPHVQTPSLSSTDAEANSSTLSASTSKAPSEASKVKSYLDNTIEEDVFTLGEEENKSNNSMNLSPFTRMCVYKVEPTFLDDPLRRADLARALPSMHAVVFVCSPDSKNNSPDVVAQYDSQWMPFVNGHANRRMLRAFVVPPSSASAPGCDAQVKTASMAEDAHMHVKNIVNSEDVRAFSLDLFHQFQSSLPESERGLLSASPLPSASYGLPSTGTGTRTLLSFSEATHASNDRITVSDVLQQMQAGDDVSKLHHQTPFTSYVSSLMSSVFFAFLGPIPLKTVSHHPIMLVNAFLTQASGSMDE